MRKLTFIFMCLTLAACDPGRVFDDTTAITEQAWESSQPVSFSAEIADTSKRYNLYVNVRHGNDYPFINLWVQINTEMPGGESMSSRVELPLANNKTGWYGNCMGDICDIQVPIQMNAIFTKAGTYTWTLEQNMRRDPLPSIREIGLRIEVAQPPSS